MMEELNLTNREERILKFYRSIAKDGKFYGSHKWLAEKMSTPELDIPVIAVRRANDRFRDLGLLRWVSGFGNYKNNQNKKNKQIRGAANQYQLMENIEGAEDTATDTADER